MPSPDCDTAELRNECFVLFMLSRFSKQEQTLYPGKPNNGEFLDVNVTFETEVAHFQDGIASEKRP